MTPGRQAVIILWEANTQYRDSNGLVKSVTLDGENIEDKLQILKNYLWKIQLKIKIDKRKNIPKLMMFYVHKLSNKLKILIYFKNQTILF